MTLLDNFGESKLNDSNDRHQAVGERPCEALRVKKEALGRKMKLEAKIMQVRMPQANFTSTVEHTMLAIF